MSELGEEEYLKRGRGAVDAPRISSRKALAPRPGYWKGSISDRLRVARGLPQAVIKITSHNKGRKSVKARLEYIARDGELMIETETGERLSGLEEVHALLSDWESDFGQRKNGRDSTTIVLSFPKGVDSEKAYIIAQEFLEEQYGHNWRYAFAAHKDTDHCHIHAVIKTIGMNGKALPTLKADLQEWRYNMAEKAREHGVKLDASPRYARGLADRSNEKYFKTARIDPWIKGAKVKALDRGNIGTILKADKQADKYSVEFINPKTDHRIVKEFKAKDIKLVHLSKEAIKAARAELKVKDEVPKHIKQALLDKNEAERIEYARAAFEVAKGLPDVENEDTAGKYIDVARDLTRYAKSMPVPFEKTPEADYKKKPGGEKVGKLMEVIKDFVTYALEKREERDRDIDI